MIQFDSFMQAEGVPIYQQIIRYVKQGIAAGTIRDGEELPSRRVLSALLAIFPGLETIRGTFGYRMLMIVFKLLLLPVVVGITYEINRWCGRNDNAFTRALSAPGMWMQHFTTNEPDDSMIEVGIAAVQAVLPEKEGSDRW